jgi:flagellar motor switch protein FliG
MSYEKVVVLTSYGHGDTIDRIAASMFDTGDDRSHALANANTYCDTINALELQGEAWMVARIVSENVQYTLDVFTPNSFTSLIAKLDNTAIQKLLKEIKPDDLSEALTDVDKKVKDKILTNLSTRTSKSLQSDIWYHRFVLPKDVAARQREIVKTILHLAETGEIAIPSPSPEGGAL